MSFDITPPGEGERQKAKGESVSPPPLPNTPPPIPATSHQPLSASLASPIADLSYRNYDGPLHARTLRWWTVSLATIRLNIKKVGFWIVVALSLLPYLFIGVLLFMGVIGGSMPMSNPFGGVAPEFKYAETFFQAWQGQQLFLFILALIVGSGSIAADNQANALLVYLSKPLTKGDYLLGKWMGVFLSVTAVALGPALLLYFYCLLSYMSKGFLKNEPFLLLQLIGAAMVPGAIHASLVVGLSAWSKTPRLAGAAYAGVYFISSTISAILWGVRFRGDLAKGNIERHLSVSGVIEGLAQNLLNVTISPPGPRRMEGNLSNLAPPELWAMLLLGGALVVIGVMAARMRIRAVEVVRG
jgi:ABC-2 type transport system permease protein